MADNSTTAPHVAPLAAPLAATLPAAAAGTRERVQQFIETSSQFRLGGLPTESAHPASTELAELAKNDLPQAIQLFKNVELMALELLLSHLDAAHELTETIRRVLQDGHRVFICGCGATGRLALVLESIWREQPLPGKREDIIAFTAGGDFALVRSLGIFEDKAEFGAKHLLDLGFGEGDLLIGITEGGETPFVLGAVEKATQKSKEQTWLLFCNPIEVLVRTTDRSRFALENPRVRAVALETGPMILAGSTRLQASSVLMAFVGGCLRELVTGEKVEWIFSQLIDRVIQIDPEPCATLIALEAQVYLDHNFALHRSRSASIGVLTDTTERAPTFSLAPFESSHEPLAPRSRTYLEVPNTLDSNSAWTQILGRAPRPFHPPRNAHAPAIDMAALLGFDFSVGAEARRAARGTKTQLFIDIEFEADALAFSYSSSFSPPHSSSADRTSHDYIVTTGSDRLVRQSILKYLLNLQSTLVMGRIGRYQSNLMTFVRPANNKLIDRSLRTLRALAARQGTSAQYAWIAEEASDEELLTALFTSMDNLNADEPAVIKALQLLLANAQ